MKYPRWQATDAGVPLPGLARLFDVLGEHPWTIYRFLRTAHADLGGRTALDVFKAGQVEAVVGVAENLAAGLQLRCRASCQTLTSRTARSR